MKRFQRVLSILLSGAILCTAGLFSATAAEQEPAQSYTITYQAAEITDTDALLDLAVEQAQRKSMARGGTRTWKREYRTGRWPCVCDGCFVL